MTQVNLIGRSTMRNYFRPAARKIYEILGDDFRHFIAQLRQIFVGTPVSNGNRFGGPRRSRNRLSCFLSINSGPLTQIRKLSLTFSPGHVPEKRNMEKPRISYGHRARDIMVHVMNKQNKPRNELFSVWLKKKRNHFHPRKNTRAPHPQNA